MLKRGDKMNIKEAIELLEKDELLDESIIKSYVTLLQQGEKYRKVVEEINNERLFDEYDGVYDIPSNSPKNIYKKINTIMQKYFPKERLDQSKQDRFKKAMKEVRELREYDERKACEEKMDKWFENLTTLRQSFIAYNFWDNASYEDKKEEYEIE